MVTAQINGTTLAYTAAGPREGTPIVFSHSLFLDRTMFDPLMERFAHQGYRGLSGVRLTAR